VRGRKPTPTALKLLRGNPSKTRINREEPTPAALSTACPVELSDPEALTEWARTIVPAVRWGHITAADRVFAIAHCELWATWRSQLADAAKHAHVVTAGQHKYPIPNPARGMANKTLLLLAKIDAELGLSPSSRSRVRTDGLAAQDDFTAFEKGSRRVGA
jgi:P27 family predicted phage terminase small subunit